MRINMKVVKDNDHVDNDGADNGDVDDDHEWY